MKKHVTHEEKQLKVEDSYTSKNIIVSTYPECVQKSPGMYIGDVNEGGMDHMVLEILANSVDEYMAGYSTKISLNLFANGFCEIEDDGRGMPVDFVDYQDEFGNRISRSGVETIFTVLHAGAKSGGDENSYKVSGGLHGVGASVVNALSEELEVTIFRANEYKMKFANGIVVEPLKTLSTTDKRGSIVRFKPSNKIFTQAAINEHLILRHVEELTFLNSNLTIEFSSERTNINMVFHFADGLLDFMKKILNKKKTIIEPMILKCEEKDFECEIALVWCTEYEDEECFAYTNNIPQPDFGYHVTGFRSGLMRSITDYLQKNKTRDYINNFQKKYKELEITSEDVRGALKSIISVRCQKPMFSSQTKTKLTSPFVRTKVEKLMDDQFRENLEKNPDLAKKIISKIFNNALARNIAKKERAKDFEMEDVDSFSIPGKLAECDKRIPPAERELLIVEGDSAAGTGKEVRGLNQAILCLQGKPNNAMKMDKFKVLATETFTMILAVLGIRFDDFKEEQVGSYLEKLRYHKIILMADADVDGKHICCLVLAFFYKYLPTLIKNGHIYLALPPLYGVKIHNKTTYLRDEEHFKRFIAQTLEENYIFESISEHKILSQEDVINLTTLCEEYKMKIQNVWKGDIPLEILSLFIFSMMQKLPYEQIQEKIKDNYPNYKLLENGHYFYLMQQLPDAKVSNSDTILQDYFVMKEQTVYGINTYHINKVLPDVNHVLLRIFPLRITLKKDKTIKVFENPFDVLNYIDHIVSKIDIKRFKGLGEMDAEPLRETTIDPKTRNLSQITLSDVDTAYTAEVIDDLMTHEGVDIRKQIILEGINKNMLIDI